ncbi:MAG: GerMN domain-containing protein [Treponema sp.]|nr:GerMN domain-containing protein [Treponema sp.]
MKKKYASLIFWLIFILFLAGLVAVNYERMRQTIVHSKLPRSFTYLFAKPSDEPLLNKPATPAATGGPAEMANPRGEIVEAAEPVENVESLEQEVVPLVPEEMPPASTVRTSTLYFVRISAEGDLIQVAVKKEFPHTSAPLTASLGSLLEGASVDDQYRGLVSFIPEGTRLLSAVIQHETAYISFNENFRYNTFGSEGYAAQIKQVIWTATEFPTVKDVQILIEGKKESYLGDSFFIGAPLNRESFH